MTHPLVAAMRGQRESWVDLSPGKAVKIRRPTEAEFPGFLRRTDAGRSLHVEIEHVQRHVVDWRGITEADLIGETVGSVDALPFDAAVWSEAVADRVDWLQAAAQGLLDVILAHLKKQDAATANLPPTLTPGQEVTAGADQALKTTPT